MYYLIMTINQDVEGKENLQSNTLFESLDEAITQWHVALSSYRTKETTIKVGCSILDENHSILKREIYNRPLPVVEEEIEEE